MFLASVLMSFAPPAMAEGPASILLALELPIAARDLRHDGVPDAEVTSVIVGSRARHLHCDEIHATLVHTHQLVLVDGPVEHLDNVVFVEMDRGVRGPDLFLYLDGYHHDHGRRHHKHEDYDRDVMVVNPVLWGPGVIVVDDHDHGWVPPGHRGHKGKWK
jgi:hypothetical protein